MSFSKTNKIISQHSDLLELVTREDLDELLRELDYDWRTGRFNPSAQLLSRLSRHGLLDEDSGVKRINRLGVLFLSRLLIQFPKVADEAVFGGLASKYSGFKVLASGKNSIVVLATHKILGSRVVLKLLRPGASANIVESVARLAKIPQETSIVLPIDYLDVLVRDALGKAVELSCLVFPFVEGTTFRDFLLQENHHLNSQIVMSFSRQIAQALLELEKIGAYHGDLHEGNILVHQDPKLGARFRIVDISFGAMGSLPLETCQNNDLAQFKQHIWRILSVQKSFLPDMSLRKYIGTRNFLRLLKVLNEQTQTFRDVCAALVDSEALKQYEREKQRFIEDRFKSPVTFLLQRYEEISDPVVAVELFVPFEPLIRSIRPFGNVFVSGNRGSGKSTYLASLAFFPSAAESQADFGDSFGVYFPCRQGEFRPFSARGNSETKTEQREVAHALGVKIVRRTLEVLATGVKEDRLIYPTDLRRLTGFVEKLVPSPGLISVEPDIQTELDNLASTLVRVELDVVARLGKSSLVENYEMNGLALIEFFEAVKATFSELSRSTFHLLFDDAGSPYLPRAVQRAVCDLMLSSNSIYCVKLSAEKFTFDFASSDGKILENGQDYVEHDISQILFIGLGSAGLKRSELEQYFRDIVEKRLKYFKFKSTRIRDYLGDGQLSVDSLLRLLAHGRRHAYYCGWTTVWNVADRTPRNLLEIVSEIFAVARMDPESEPREIGGRDQSRAIRTISEKRLESLSQISGSIDVAGRQTSLGRHLFDVTTTIGSTFRKYLSADRSQEKIRQHLAVERNDISELSGDAEAVLRAMITFGVLDSSRTGVARDDELRKPYYVLNRIYCPAFQIGFRRDDHLRLSARKLEMLLVQPERFLREGTLKLRGESGRQSPDLFGDRNGDGDGEGDDGG